MHSLFQRFALALLLCLALLLPALALSEVVELPIDFSPGMPIAEKWEQGKMSYDDPSIHVERDYYDSEEFGCRVYVVNIKIANATQLRTESCKGGENGFNTRHRDKDAAQMSNRVRAVVAMDGDFYGDHAGSFVLRQGVMFREITETYHDLLLIDEDGDFHIVLAEEHPEEMDKTAVNGKKITNALCFGPALIRDGEIVVDPSKAQEQSHPIAKEIRMAICQMGEREYMLVTNSNESLTLEEFAQFLSGFDGIQQAYNLDGGMSSHLVFMGELRNKFALINNQDYRPVPDIIYFASAYRPD